MPGDVSDGLTVDVLETSLVEVDWLGGVIILNSSVLLSVLDIERTFSFALIFPIKETGFELSCAFFGDFLILLFFGGSELILCRSCREAFLSVDILSV